MFCKHKVIQAELTYLHCVYCHRIWHLNSGKSKVKLFERGGKYLPVSFQYYYCDGSYYETGYGGVEQESY